MNIQPINYNNINFGTCVRVYSPKDVKNFKSFGKNIIRTSTNIFREDLDWLALSDYITRHFLQKSKVQIHNFACSDGSEPYSLAITFLKKIPEQGLNKYFPIIASDVDNEIIKTAQSGRINLECFELDFYDKSKLVTRDFFKKEAKALKINNDTLIYTRSYEPIKELKNAVRFHRSDILTELKTIEDKGNTVILCRNVFPYLNSEYTENVINTLNKKLDSGSLFVTGNYDEVVDISQKILEKDFFNPISDSPYIFQKK